MKVLHLMGGLNPSGMERMFVAASEYFRHADVQSTIVGQGPDHPFAPELQAAGYNLLTIPSIRTARGARAWRDAVQRNKPDVIHIHTEGGFAAAVLAARGGKHRAPIIRTIHNVFAPRGRAHLSRRLQGVVADRFVSVFVAPSIDVQQNELRMGRSPQIVENWVDDRFIKASAQRDQLISNSVPVAVMVGNCSVIKNHEIALQALYEHGYSVCHHGNESGASIDELRLLDLFAAEGRLLFRGEADPLESLMRGDVYVMPSQREGMSVAFLEAVSTGIPALVANVDGLRWAARMSGVDLVDGGQSAWRDALRSPLGAGAQSPVKSPEESTFDFSASRGTKEYVDVYRKVARR